MATSMKYYFQTDLNELLPIWHGNCFTTNPHTVKAYQTDHGEVGVDLLRVETSSAATLTVRFSKQLEQGIQWRYSGVRPFRTAKIAAKFSVPVGTTQSSRFSRKRRTPVNVKNLQEDAELPKKPEQYQGNCLSSCMSPDGSANILLSSYGSHLNKLGIETICDKLKSNASKANIFVKEFSSTGNISQVSCHTVDNKVMCAIRQQHSVHVLSASEKDKRWHLTEVAATEVNDCGITDLCLSPYIAEEILYATDHKRLILRDYEQSQDEVMISVDAPEVADGDFWVGCSFGAHPRCILCMTRQAVHQYDTRAPNTRSHCLLQLPCLMIPPDERIYCSAQDSSNSFVQYVSTTNTLLTLDERFPKYPIMKWGHLLTEPPSLCHVSVWPSQTEKVILLSNNITQDMAVIHITQEGKNLRNLHSKGNVKHFPKVCDILDQRWTCCQEGVASRLSAPLIGLCTVTSTSDDGDRLQLLQMTAAGDIFFQSADYVLGDVEQINTEDVDAFNKKQEWTDWVAEVSRHLDKTDFNKTAPATVADAHRLFEALAVEREHLCLCSFCCHCEDRCRDHPTSSTNNCTSCGNHLDHSQFLMSTYKKGSSMTGKTADKIDLSDLGLSAVDTSVSSDKRTLMILEAWDDDDDDGDDDDGDEDVIKIQTAESSLPLSEDVITNQCSQREDGTIFSEMPAEQSDAESKSFSERTSSQALSSVPSIQNDDFIPSSQQDSQVFVSRKLKRPWQREANLGF